MRKELSSAVNQRGLRAVGASTFTTSVADAIPVDGIRGELVHEERWFELPRNVHGPRPWRTGKGFTCTMPDGGMQTEEKEVWYNENVPSRAVLLVQNTERANNPRHSYQWMLLPDIS